LSVLVPAGGVAALVATGLALAGTSTPVSHVSKSTAAPVTSVRLFAKAGPVTMHADLTLTLTPVTGTNAIGALSNCVVVKPTSSPRSGIADKIVCKNATGQKVVVQAAPTSASFSYKLANSNQHMNMTAATIEIRHASSVLFTLTPSSGTLTIPMSHVAALLNGQDKLYVHAATHTYQGEILHVS